MTTLSEIAIAPPLAPPRSTFITVLAWFSIALAGLATFVSMVQAIMFFIVFDRLKPMTDRPWPGTADLPPLVQYLFAHPELFLGVFWTLSALTLVAGVGLLRRRNWARIYFIAALAFGIVWQVSGVWIQRRMMQTLPTAFHNLPSEFASEMERAQNLVSAGAIVFAALTCVLFVWLIKRLLSKDIHVEFRAP